MAEQNVPKSDTKNVIYSSMKVELAIENNKVNEAVDFYKVAFGGIEVAKEVNGKRKAESELPLLTSAEVQICGFAFLLVDLGEKVKSAGSGATFFLETDDVAAAVDKAVAAGATADGEIAESEDGLVGKLKDPFGYEWVISSPAKKAAEVGDA